MDWIIDTDMGLDDHISLLYLATISQQLGSNFNIKAVLTQGNGLAHSQAAKNNAVRLLRFSGISAKNVPPVGTGSQDSLDGFHQYPPEWRYPQDNLQGAILPLYSKQAERQNSTSSALLKRILSRSDQKVSILELGAHTTLAQVLSAKPALAKKIDHIVSMIGAVDVPGNILNTPNKVAEFNAWIDPVAAKKVFDSGIPMIMVPLDVTNKAPLTVDFINRFRAGTKGPQANLLVNWLEGALKNPVGEYYHWDPLATAIAVSPDLVTRSKNLRLSVNADPSQPRQPKSVPYGHVKDFSLLNWRGDKRSSLDPLTSGWTQRDRSGKSINVVFDADIPRFEQNLISAFSQDPTDAPTLRPLFGDSENASTTGTTSYPSPGAYWRDGNGQAAVTLQALPAPGAVRLGFEGDALSRYQGNVRRIVYDDVRFSLNDGSFNGPIQVQGEQLVLASAQPLHVIRTDSGNGRVDFGVSQGNANVSLVQQAKGASQANLTADQLFCNDPASNWQSSEGQAQGSGGSALVVAGDWRPTAVLDGVELPLLGLEVEANGAVARFAAGNPEDSSDDILATFCLPGSGSINGGGNGVLTVRRLSTQANGLALYQADPVTGAVLDGTGNTLLPGQAGYLQAALATARHDGLVWAPQQLPGFGQTSVLSALSLPLNRNYGALLLVNGSESELLSSYNAANPDGVNQCLSLIAPGRGISFAFEDRLPWQGSDRDYNDLSVTLTASQPAMVS